MEFLYPYLLNKDKWPYRHDVEHFESWPVRQPSLLFSSYAFGEGRYLDLWKKLNPDPTDPEVRRNLAVTQPLLWLLNQRHTDFQSETPLVSTLSKMTYKRSLCQERGLQVVYK